MQADDLLVVKKEENAAPAPSTPKKKRKAKVQQKSPGPSPKKRSPTKAAAPKLILCSSDLAKISSENPWMDLQVPPHELRPSTTLTTGQCFNWMVVHDDTIDLNNSNSTQSASSSAWGTHNETEWVGPVQDLVLSIRETPSTTLYRILHGPSDPDVNMTHYLADYFQLDTPLEPLYREWSANDERLSKIAPVIPGVRIIRQDPIECLFSFICSSNNNIPRITKMLSSFRETYGVKMMDLPVRLLGNDGDGDVVLSGEPVDRMSIYSFPTLEQLKKQSTEEQLRGLGLGYRAKYIIQTRDLLIESGGKDYLLGLRSKDSETVQEELLKFSGIGRKVADCVALFSLDQSEAIPVDVHVQHIASRDYDPTVLGQAKSLTPTIYKRVGDLFRDRFEYAGWAHSLLFVAELPSFRNVLPEDVVAEMDAVS
jgi:N-glycosylase/DNA lyase